MQQAQSSKLKKTLTVGKAFGTAAEDRDDLRAARILAYKAMEPRKPLLKNKGNNRRRLARYISRARTNEAAHQRQPSKQSLTHHVDALGG